MVKYAIISLFNEDGYLCSDANIIKYKCGRRDLRWYSTIVCSVLKDGEFVRKWDGYSATTMLRINSFLRQCGCEAINKKKWMSMAVCA